MYAHIGRLAIRISLRYMYLCMREKKDVGTAVGLPCSGRKVGGGL